MQKQTILLETTIEELRAMNQAIRSYQMYIESLSTEPTTLGATLQAYEERILRQYPASALPAEISGPPQETRPTFKQLRQLYGITVEQLIEETHLDSTEVLLVDASGIGKSAVIDALLQALSRLSGETYTRLNVGGLSFTLETVEVTTRA